MNANIDKIKSLKGIALSNIYSNMYVKNCKSKFSDKLAFWYYNPSQLGGHFLSFREICLLSWVFPRSPVLINMQFS